MNAELDISWFNFCGFFSGNKTKRKHFVHKEASCCKNYLMEVNSWKLRNFSQKCTFDKVKDDITLQKIYCFLPYLSNLNCENHAIAEKIPSANDKVSNKIWKAELPMYVHQHLVFAQTPRDKDRLLQPYCIQQKRG